MTDRWTAGMMAHGTAAFRRVLEESDLSTSAKEAGAHAWLMCLIKYGLIEELERRGDVASSEV